MIVKKLPLTQVQASVQASAQNTSDDQTLKGLTSLGVAIEQLGGKATHIGIWEISEGILAFYVRAEFEEPVTVSHVPPVKTVAMTWHALATIGSDQKSGLAARVRSAVADEVDQFINAWLSVNPRRQTCAQNRSKLSDAHYETHSITHNTGRSEEKAPQRKSL
jgi:sirohydrochlorin ferrochelatase